MSVQVRAALRTAKLFAIASIIPIVIMFLFRLDSDTLLELFLLAFLSWMVWVVYQINLSQLQSEDKIKEIQERRSTMISSIVDKE